MALLSSSGKCGESGGGSPPPVRVLGSGGGGGNTDPLLSPALYCPVLPPWHLALLTHHALHARGLSAGTPAAYLPLPPMLASMPHAQSLHHHRAAQGLSSGGLLQSPMETLHAGLGRRDLPSPTKHTLTPPLPARRLAQPRRSFTIADLLGGGDDLQEDTRGASSSTSPPAGGHDASLMQTESVGGLYDDQHESPSSVHQQGEFPAASDPGSRFEWLQCTRYHPPKLPRVKAP
ncbi:uncharacterized protein LOC123507093 [Portunus trituberculatus]|uniref:uncharacterized protein LOC123507093 n=1 Tax=Portunus trituberculatus TaxID=210409 RepID=UPI001E1CF9EB|nr:uncharacterized protein LOC123507093 [Portunus trituberculatus]